MKLRRNSSKTLRQSTNTYTHASANPLSTPRSEHTNTHTFGRCKASKQTTDSTRISDKSNNNNKQYGDWQLACLEGPQSNAKRTKKNACRNKQRIRNAMAERKIVRGKTKKKSALPREPATLQAVESTKWEFQPFQAMQLQCSAKKATGKKEIQNLISFNNLKLLTNLRITRFCCEEKRTQN